MSVCINIADNSSTLANIEMLQLLKVKCLNEIFNNSTDKNKKLNEIFWVT